MSWNFNYFISDWWFLEVYHFGDSLSISNFFVQKPLAGKDAAWDNYGFVCWVCFLKFILIYGDSTPQSMWLTFLDGVEVFMDSPNLSAKSVKLKEL